MAHLPYIDSLGTDMQAVSPRPYQPMHSGKPAEIAQWSCKENNNLIYRQAALYPDRFFRIGLPQPAGEPVAMAIKELEPCVR